MAEEEWKRILIKNRMYLSESLHPEDLWGHMIENELITKAQIQRITKANHADSDQVGAILDHIGRRHKDAFDSFCSIIGGKGFGFVLDKILGQKESSSGTKPSPSDKSSESFPMKQIKRNGGKEKNREAECTVEPIQQDAANDDEDPQTKPGSGRENVNDPSKSPLLVEEVPPSEKQNNRAEYIGEPRDQYGVDDGNAGAGCYTKNKKYIRCAIVIAVLSVSVVVLAVPLAVSSSAQAFTSNRNILQTTQQPTVLPGAVKLDIEEACRGNKTLYSFAGPRGTDSSRCQFNSGNSFLKNPQSCSKFGFCCQHDSQRRVGSCPEHYTFHPESQTCEFTKKTFYRDPYDCGKYHRCFQNEPSSTSRTVQRCNTGLHFNMDTPEPTCAYKEQVFDCIQPETVPTTSQGVD